LLVFFGFFFWWILFFPLQALKVVSTGIAGSKSVGNQDVPAQDDDPMDVDPIPEAQLETCVQVNPHVVEMSELWDPDEMFDPSNDSVLGDDMEM
jgi:hypothetical protein